jgi:hypothetical protein
MSMPPPSPSPGPIVNPLPVPPVQVPPGTPTTGGMTGTNNVTAAELIAALQTIPANTPINVYTTDKTWGITYKFGVFGVDAAGNILQGAFIDSFVTGK